MKKKKVWRYYCEFCKKAGCNAYWMKKHEERCTMNPDRICGYCKLLEQPQSDLTTLRNILPHPDRCKRTDKIFGEHYKYTEEVAAAYKQLEEASGGCPACVMAAIRQTGHPVGLFNEFDFKGRCEEIWAVINAENNKEHWEAESR